MAWKLGWVGYRNDGHSGIKVLINPQGMLDANLKNAGPKAKVVFVLFLFLSRKKKKARKKFPIAAKKQALRGRGTVLMITWGLEISKNPVFERLDFERVGYSASNTHCEIRNLLTGYRDPIRISSSKLNSEMSPALD